MAKAFLDSDDSSDEEGGAALANGQDFKINEDFANRFTYNKKREELARLEEKHGKTTGKRKRDDEPSEESEESSTSEDEDDAGNLATEALDSEIFATLNAIRSKDPKVYDSSVNFYTPIEEDGADATSATRTEKPMFLRDYHRETLLNGNGNTTKDEPLSYNQEQAALKNSIVAEMHAAVSDESSEDEMLVAKERPKRSAKSQPVDIDVDNADKDPEDYLNRFMSARAWVPTKQSRFQALESDDSEDDRRAEEYEEAYNLRFEDPAKSNEKLRTHDREIAAKYSVRREEMNPRKKKRESEREKREREKQDIRDEKARLRKLRIEEVEEKVRRIKRAAGSKSDDIKPEDWAKFVDEDWDDAQWEAEMQTRFGDEYYQEDDAPSNDEGGSEVMTKKRKVKKPKFDDDIDIKDIVPDFVSEEEAEFSMTDEEVETQEKPKASKKHNKEKEDRKKESKKERRIIEQLVDDRLELDTALRSAPAKSNGFRYRDTSPTSFGLSSRDILMADDSQLNQFVGLKKLAAFRDPTKKQKDRKHLGKKARLRNWRKETFGDEEGPRASELFAGAKTEGNGVEEANGNGKDGPAGIVEGARKKKRRRHKKATAAGEVISIE
jgi:protein KRI1